MKTAFLISMILLGFVYGNSAVQTNSPVVITLPLDSSSTYPLQNLSYKKPEAVKISLILSGGGARGFAHIGVIRALEENHIPISLVVGSSMGSVIGGLYAAGFNSSQLSAIVRQIDWENIFSEDTYRSNLFWSQKTTPRRHLLELRFQNGLPYLPSAITSGQKIFGTIYDNLLRASFQGVNNFDNLPVPFRAVATDLLSGRRVVLDQGNLAEAMSASVAIPLLFSPVEINGMWLADGGIRDNLPVDVALEEGADVTIAVDVTSPLREAGQLLSPWQVADQVTTIMMQNPTAESGKRADIWLQPDLEGHGASDFSAVDSLIEAGYQAALSQIDSLRQIIQQRQNKFYGNDSLLGRVARVRLDIQSGEDTSAVADLVPDRKGDLVSRYELMNDLAAYYKSGQVHKAWMQVSGPKNSLNLDIKISLNPVVDSIRVSGNSLMPDSLLLNHLNKIPENTILNFNRLFSALDAILQMYVNAGYPLVHFNSVAYDSKNRLLLVEIEEGLIQTIKIKGNDVTKDFIILREIPVEEGDYFTAEKANQGIRNIYSTGLFNRVTMNVVQLPEGNMLVIKVKEKKYLLMRIGAHASLERKGEVFMELADENLLGREIKTSLFGSIGDLRRQLDWSLYSIRLFKSLLTYRLSLYYKDRTDRYYQEFERLGDYKTTRRGIRFVLGQQIERLGSISAEIRWDHVRIESPVEDFSFQNTYRIRSLALRSVVDKRDRIPFPQKGINNRWFWESGSQKIFGGSVSFTRFYLGLEGYYPLIPYWVYHVEAEGGSADLTLPFPEFFTMGGLRDFPGLRENERFGRQMLHFSNELRHNLRHALPFDLYLGLSFHVGSTWGSSEDSIDRQDFLTGLGAYAAVNTLFGPIRLEYGHLTGIRDLIYFSAGYRF
ncbi:MAG: patatin-like phospholipase family protein [Calditrichia bacterium]